MTYKSALVSLGVICMIGIIILNQKVVVKSTMALYNGKETSRSNSSVFIPNLDLIKKLHHDICGDHPSGKNLTFDFSAPWIQWKDILLVVVFNTPVYQSIPYYEVANRPFFPNILYCVPGNFNRSQVAGLEGYNISVVSYRGAPKPHRLAAFNQQCSSLAIKMNFNVKGYLVAGDDVVLVQPKLQELDTSKIWINGKQHGGVLPDARQKKKWPFYKIYANETIRAFDELATSKENPELFHRCLETLEHDNEGKYIANNGNPDIYYIPGHLARDYSQIVDVFVKNQVWVAIAVYTTLNCLVPDEREQEEVQRFRGLSIWGEHKIHWHSSNFPLDQIPTLVDLHPVKWGFINKLKDTGKKKFDEEARSKRLDTIDFFCKVIPILHNPPVQHISLH